MKKIVVLGSGLVSRPGVQYLLDNEDFFVTVASNELENARFLIQGYDNGKAVYLDVKDKEELTALVKDNDVVVSLLPWVFHVQVAEICLEYGKDLATASYVSPDMRQLNDAAKNKGLLFLNELGLDPGIDHMSAMKIIAQVADEGGKVVHFYSFCGGLPAPEDNDNPFGYKFSWSPKGVLLAARNSARYLENDKVVEVEGKDLFLDCRVEAVGDLGNFEVYPNRDSVPYKEIYGLTHAQTVMRGTYRYPGWCATLKAMVDLGLVDGTPLKGLSKESFKEMMAELLGIDANEDVVAATAKKIGIDPDNEIISRFQWLGLFDGKPVPDYDNYLDIISHVMQEKLYYKNGEKDMIVLQHRFEVENKDGSLDTITSTLIDFGVFGKDTSMARTVSLPLAIGVKLLAQGKIDLTGVHIPVEKEIYEPILQELEELGVHVVEKRFPRS